MTSVFPELVLALLISVPLNTGASATMVSKCKLFIVFTLAKMYVLYTKENCELFC